MFKLEEFKQLVRDFGDVADFLVVYVAEAHSTGRQHPAAHIYHHSNVKQGIWGGSEVVYTLI